MLARACLVLLVLPAALSAAELPQEHAYQRTLRQWLATLTADDFRVEPKPFPPPTTELSDAQKYRHWLLLQSYGTAQSSGLALPPELFTLAALEAGDKVQVPPVSAIDLAWLSGWDFPGNPYRGSRAVRLRALMHTVVDLVLHDHLHEHGDGSANRSDFLGGTLIWLAYNYGQARDAMPQDARAAYEAGLKKLVLRLKQWGPRGAMTDMDLFAPVGLRYAAAVLADDAEVREIAADYSRRLYTEPRFFHPAGYFVDAGCFDVSYNGISLFFNAWAATVSDWPFARDALAKAYRLRAHLTFPEPGGGALGPSHVSSRTSADSPNDQWSFTHRHAAAAMLTDEALYAAPWPTPDQLKNAMPHLLAALNAQQAPVKPGTVKMQPWAERHWTSLPNFAYLHFKDEFYERLAALRRADSPLLKPALLRPGTFVENFADTFLVAKLDGFATALHTGPVAGWHLAWKRPYGFGGGAVSAFWTPATGSIILGRRRGIQGHVWDALEEWRAWPTHAVSGLTKAGRVVSSARLADPKPSYSTGPAEAHVRVGAELPRADAVQGQILDGAVVYGRQFDVDRAGVRVRTAVHTDGRDALAELYEIIPILRSPSAATKEPERARIEFEIGGTWHPATVEFRDGVTAVRISRHKGAARITFDRPRRVKLSDADWVDGFQSQVVCRNVLIDLLEKGAGAAGKPIRVEVGWRIAPEP